MIGLCPSPCALHRVRFLALASTILCCSAITVLTMTMPATPNPARTHHTNPPQSCAQQRTDLWDGDQSAACVHRCVMYRAWVMHTALDDGAKDCSGGSRFGTNAGRGDDGDEWQGQQRHCRRCFSHFGRPLARDGGLVLPPNVDGMGQKDC